MRVAHLAWLLSQELKKGSMTMKILKRALSLFIVGLFVFTAFAVIQSGGSQAQASPSGSSSFTFPYQYGTPTVPSDVGAQGIQGPNVPLSQIGLDGHSVGYSGHPGPVNDSNPFIFSNVPTVQVSVQVYNGTVSSHTVGVGQSVYLYNTSLNTFAKGGATNSLGQFVFNVTEGHWQLGVNETSASSYISFMDLVDPMKASSYSIYLLPVSDSSVSVGNGGIGTIWYSTGPDLGQYNKQGFPNLNVTLENASASDAILKTAVTMSNGSVEFTNVNTTYSYLLVTYGYSQSLNGWTYYMGNSTSNPFSIGSTDVISLTDTSPVEDSGGGGCNIDKMVNDRNRVRFHLPNCICGR